MDGLVDKFLVFVVVVLQTEGAFCSSKMFVGMCGVDTYSISSNVRRQPEFESSSFSF